MNKTLLLVASVAALLASSPVFAGTDSPSLADRHVKAGLKCDSCHGKAMAVKAPGIAQCGSCHNPEKLAEKTKGMKPANPHKSPHWETYLDCTLCHSGHAKPVNYCEQCHAFGFKVP